MPLPTDPDRPVPPRRPAPSSRVAPRRRRALLIALCGGIVVASCRIQSRRVLVEEVPRAGATTTRLTVPVKAHLVSGAVVLFRDGATVTADSVIGSAVRYEPTLLDSALVGGVSLDSVAALESFSPDIDRTQSALLSTAATTAGLTATAVGTAGLLKALFGSCPTVYVDSAGTDAMQAELFSYSIAPLFENRDFDEVRTTGDAAGRVELTIRNEALETHYINHLELLEVTLRPGERMVHDEEGKPLAMAPVLTPPDRATDRSGRDVTGVLAAVDGREFGSSPARLAAAVDGDFGDAIDLVFPAPATTQIGLVLRVRNSLLNTILLYDIMLGAGAPSVQWLGGDLDRIPTAARLGRWYVKAMGLRVSVRDGDGWREVARVPDVGPLAWKDVVVRLPAAAGEPVHARLEFTADNYRLDAVGLADPVRSAPTRRVPVADVRGADGEARPDALRALRGSDRDYLITGPGDRFQAVFETGPATGPRAFLLSSRGYYIEWVRGDWVRQPTVAERFEPGDDALRAMYRRWVAVRDEFETEFHERRVPTP